MIETIVKCDVCQKVRGEGNGFFVGYALPPDEGGGAEGYAVMHWSERISKGQRADHFCGIGCALKKQSEFFGATQ